MKKGTNIDKKGTNIDKKGTNIEMCAKSSSYKIIRKNLMCAYAGILQRAHISKEIPKKIEKRDEHLHIVIEFRGLGKEKPSEFLI